jgi:ATP-dependent protease ClpP protease subunit
MPEIVNRFWNFVNATNESIELRIDGNIVDDESYWIYEWFGIKAAAPNPFRVELAKHVGKKVEVWINSNGGNVFAGIGMFNALMEHRNKGGKVTAVIEKAMSAATLPLMAAAERLIYPGAMCMTHNPLNGAYGYASDLRKMANILDEVKKAIVNVYQLGTGLAREVISKMMDDETYMSANTAIENKFATAMKYNSDGKIGNIVNLSFNRLDIQNAVGDSVQSFIEFMKVKQAAEDQLSVPTDSENGINASINANQAFNKLPDANITLNERSNDMDIKNVDDLKRAYPEFVNQITADAKNQGIQEERKRIQDIAAVSSRIEPALVSKALFENPIDAKELTFQAYQADATAGTKYLASTLNDSLVSGVNGVGAVPVQNNISAPAGGSPEKSKSVGEKFVNLVQVLNAKRMGVQ